jgi:hypothetical protein
LQAVERQEKSASIEWVKKEFAQAWKHSSTMLTIDFL